MWNFKIFSGGYTPGHPSKKGGDKREGKTGEGVGQGAEGEGIGVSGKANFTSRLYTTV